MLEFRLKKQKNRENEMEERAYPCLGFLPVSTGLIPYFMSAHQADSNCSRETQSKGTLIHPLPLSPCLSLSAPE